MIENNKFYLNDLKTIVFFGYSEKFEELLDINKELKLNSFIITDPNQSKLIKKKLTLKNSKNLMIN